jgi:hypothetical protein
MQEQRENSRIRLSTTNAVVEGDRERGSVLAGLILKTPALGLMPFPSALRFSI